MVAAGMVLNSLFPGAGMALATDTTENTEAVVIHVTDFGADPGGGRDSAEAIIKALDEAAELRAEYPDRPIVVDFPRGEYQIYPDKAEKRELYMSNTSGENEKYKDRTIGILVEDIDDITIEGNGSDFVFHGKMTTFAALRSENVTFQNFSVDFAVPTAIDLTVEKVEGNTATVHIPECIGYQVVNNTVRWLSDKSPYTGQYYWTETGWLGFDMLTQLDTGLVLRTFTKPFTGATIADAGDHRITLTYDSIPGDIRVGNCYSIRQTARDNTGAFIWLSKNATLENLDVHYIHGFGLLAQTSDTLTFRDVDFVAQTQMGRITTGYADCIQASGCKGLIEIADGYFANTHDDPINIHGTYQKVTAISEDRREVTVHYEHHETAGFPSFAAGDMVEFSGIETLNPVGDVYEVEEIISGPTGDSSGDGIDLRTTVIRFTRPVSEEITVNDCVIENITYTPDVHIHDNIFKQIPTKCVLTTTRGKIVIEDNIFESINRGALHMQGDAKGWYESGRITDLLIQNNVFYRCGVGGNGLGGEPTIYFCPTNNEKLSEEPVHTNVRILNNTFYQSGKNEAIWAKSVSDLTIEGNRFFRVNPDVDIQLSLADTTLSVGDTTTATVQTGGATATYNRVYVINACKNVVMKDNTYDYGMNVQTTADNMDRNEIHIDNDDVKIFQNNLRAAVAPVGYESSDPTVATVTDKGVVTAHKAGAAVITAYSVMNGRKYISNTQTVQVGGSTAQPTPVTDAASANSRLINATCTGVDLGEFQKYTYYYAAQAKDTDQVDFTFEPEQGATLYTLLNGQKLTATGENRFHIDLQEGFNIVETFVTAADGETRTVYRFALLHSTGATVQVNDLQVNGATVEGFDPDTMEYTCFADSDTVESVSVSIDTDGQPAITANGVRTEGASAQVALRDRITEVTVAAHSVNGTPSKYYVLRIRKPDGDNAALAEVQMGDFVTLDTPFDTATTAYTGRVLAEEVTVRFIASEKVAPLTLSYGGQTYTGKGRLEQTLPIYKGENRITLQVTSPNGQVHKTYTFLLTAPEVVYLSDLAYDPDASYCGNSRENNIEYDHSTGNTVAGIDGAFPGTITLRQEDGTPRAFERGIGTHATSNVVYNIEGLAVDTFSTYFGTDQEIKDLNSGGITFSFYVDGVELDYEGKGTEMNGKTPMKQIAASVKGASQLRLYADQGATAAHDHASYGDAKFTTTFTERTDKGDKTKLRQAYDQAVGMMEDGSLAVMIPDTVEAFKAAVEEAKAVLDYENATQNEVDAAEVALEAARQALKRMRYGDTNLNGEITAEDALLALQAATGKIPLTTAQETVADVDGVTGVTANDALLILQCATQKITGFPVEG